MNQHLEAAYKRDTRKKIFLINPISKVDAEIIFELSISLGRVGLKGEQLKSIIENYKFLKDTDIRDSLLQFNIDNPLLPAEVEEEDDNKRRFVDFDGEIVEQRLIKTVGKDSYYNFENKKMEYFIIINKDLEEKYMLTNGTFKYSSEELRDKKLNELKIKLSNDIKIV